jgi:hypothetical protein
LHAQHAGNDPQDVLEQEADRAAYQVATLPRQAENSTAESPPTEQTEEKPDAEVEAPIRVRFAVPPEDPPPEAGGSQPPRVAAGGGEPLPRPVRHDFERHFGEAFDDVRVHRDAAAAAFADQIQAQAFTYGSHVYFDAGRFAPETGAGQELLAHELTHVVQQRGAQPVIQRQADPAVSRPPSPASPGLLISDEAVELAPGQMRKSEFMAALRAEVCRTVDEVLAGTPYSSRGCPYVEFWLGFYAERDAAHIERALNRYVPHTRSAASAQEYITLTSERVRRTAVVWRDTGRLADVPEGIPANSAAPPIPPPDESGGDAVAPIAAIPVNGASAASANPRALRQQLGRGAPLEGSVRGRLEGALGVDLGHVRVHTDAGAAALSRSLRSRAFTVGADVAFGSGEYRPGTPVGDALLAHELAHTVQQSASVAAAEAASGSGPAQYALLEQDADAAAFGAVTRLWGRATETLGALGRRVTPSMQSGLRLQACRTDTTVDTSRQEKQAQEKLEEFRGLYERRQKIILGELPLGELAAVEKELDKVHRELQDLGLNLSQSEIFEALQAGNDLLQIRGRLVQTPPGSTVFPGERTELQVQTDYVPQGELIEVGWTLKLGEKGSFVRSLRAPSSSRTFLLDEAFWGRELGNIERHGPFEIQARIYLKGESEPRHTVSTGQLTLGGDVPANLTIQPALKTVMKGAGVVFNVAEFAPHFRRNSIIWSVNGKEEEVGSLFFHHRFNRLGENTVTADIYRRKYQWEFGKPYRKATAKLEVQEPSAIARTSLSQMQPGELPALSEVGSTIRSSITELSRRVAQGGAQKPFLEERLEAQEERLESFQKNVPDQRGAQPLPDDLSTMQPGVTYSGPIPTVLVIPQSNAVQPVSMYLTVWHQGSQWQARLNDVTGKDIYPFSGSGATPQAAAENAFDEWIDDNPYPMHGRIHYRFNATGWSKPTDFTTNSNWKIFKAWVDGVLAIGAIIVAGILFLVPEPTGLTKALGYAVLAATVARSTVAIYENIQLGIDAFDERNVLEAVSIVSTFVGIGGTVLRQAGLRATSAVTYRVGNWMVLTSVASDVGTLVYLSSEALDSVRAIQADPTLDDAQKAQATFALVTRLITSAGMLILSNKDLFKGGLRRSDFLPTDPRLTTARAGTGVVKLETGERLDIQAELRRAGDKPGALRDLSNRDLVDRYQTLPWLNAELNPTQVQQMLGRLETPALVRLRDLGAAEAKALVDAMGNDALTNALAPSLGGVRMRNLLNATSPQLVAELHAAFGAGDLRNAIDLLEVARIQRLLTGSTAAELRAFAQPDTLGLPALRNLGNELTGLQIRPLVGTHGAETVRWAAADLSGNDVRFLLSRLDPPAAAGLRDVTGREALFLLNQYQPGLLNGLSPIVNGSNLLVYLRAVGPFTARGRARRLIERNRAGDINDYARNVATARTGTGALVNPPPLTGGTFVADANYMNRLSEANQALAGGTPATSLTAVQQNAIAFQNTLPAGAGGTVDMRMPNPALAEHGVRPGAPAYRALPIPEGVRSTPEYQGLLGTLEANRIGGRGAEGAADRGIVADVFFAPPAAGRPTVFITADGTIFRGLARLGGHTPRGRLSLVNTFPDGFTVTVNIGGSPRTIHVIFIRGDVVTPTPPVVP